MIAPTGIWGPCPQPRYALCSASALVRYQALITHQWEPQSGNMDAKSLPPVMTEFCHFSSFDFWAWGLWGTYLNVPPPCLQLYMSHFSTGALTQSIRPLLLCPSFWLLCPSF